MADIPFFNNVFEHIDSTIIDVLLTKTATLMQIFSPVISAGLTVYLAFVFLSYFDNPAQQTIIDLFKRTFAIFVMLAFSVNISIYNEYVMPIVVHLGEFLASKFSGNVENISDGFDVILGQMIDALLDEIRNTGTLEVGKLIMIGLTALFMFPAFIIFAVLCGSYLLVGKVYCALLAVTGPLFISLGLFPATRQFFHNWVNQVVTYNLMIFFLNVLVGVFVSYMKSAVGDSIEMTFRNAFIIQVGSGLFFILLLKIPQFSASLGNGMTMNGISDTIRIVTNFVTMGKGKLASQAVKQGGGSLSPIKSERAGK